ncbi:hypothetical protein IJJ12_01270 [bacterium]|nr:hypothetical protein [bacterium]
MDKDALASVGVIALLLIVIGVATYYNNSQQFVATRGQLNQVVSKTLSTLLTKKKEATAAQIQQTTCPACEVPTPSPTANQKQQFQADPIPYVRDALSAKFATQLSAGELESVYTIGSHMYWRDGSDGYRISVDGGKTLSLQVPSTAKAYQVTPDKTSDTHPALRHPLLAKVSQEVSRALKKIDFKQSHFSECPLWAPYDPFDNCVATFTKNDMKCSLVALYGRYGQRDIATDDPYLRLELSCSDNYDTAYALQAPYLYAVNLISPPWATPDMVVEELAAGEGLTWVNFGYTSAYFQEIDSGLRLLDQADLTQSCQIIRQADGSQQLSCQ